MTIRNVKRGEPITADHINRIKRAATKQHTGVGVFETDDFVAHRPIGGPSGGLSMRWVVAAGMLSSTTQAIGTYPLTQAGNPIVGDETFSLSLGDDGLPKETEVIAVWPGLKAADFTPFFVSTGAAQDSVQDYEAGTGKLLSRVTILPAYLVDGIWRVHNTARLAWANPVGGIVFSSCGGAS